MVEKRKQNTNKGKSKNIEFWLIIIFILFAVLISIEQYVSWGSFFEFKDIHHEMFIVMFIFGALLIAILSYLRKR